MTITLRCASDAIDGVSRFPVLPGRLSDCYDVGTKVPNRAKMVRLLATSSEKHVQFGADDCDAVLAIGIDYINSFNEYAHELAAEIGKDGGIEVGDVPSKARNQAERRIKKGRVSFVRVYITFRAVRGEVVFRVSWNNPMSIVGRTDKDTREMAIMCVQLAQAMALEYNSTGRCSDPTKRPVRVVVEDHKMNPGLCKEADEDAETRILAAKRADCGHRRNIYCTTDAEGNPPDFNCPLYLNGMCKEIER